MKLFIEYFMTNLNRIFFNKVIGKPNIVKLYNASPTTSLILWEGEQIGVLYKDPWDIKYAANIFNTKYTLRLLFGNFSTNALNSTLEITRWFKKLGLTLYYD